MPLSSREGGGRGCPTGIATPRLRSSPFRPPTPPRESMVRDVALRFRVTADPPHPAPWFCDYRDCHPPSMTPGMSKPHSRETETQLRHVHFPTAMPREPLVTQISPSSGCLLTKASRPSPQAEGSLLVTRRPTSVNVGGSIGGFHLNCTCLPHPCTQVHGERSD